VFCHTGWNFAFGFCYHRIARGIKRAFPGALFLRLLEVSQRLAPGQQALDRFAVSFIVLLPSQPCSEELQKGIHLLLGKPFVDHGALLGSQFRQGIAPRITQAFPRGNFGRLGSSGGIDSAVTLALACQALGNENVLAVAMPSGFSSTHSVEDATLLSQRLNNPFQILPIQPVYESFLGVLKPVFQDLPFGLAEENIQSRSRGNLLMSIANKFGYILLNTSNKSELSTGYGTLYGDMAGGLSVLGDLYKMQVYALARLINADEEIIPQSILEKAPSAELRPDQKDSDSLPEYDLLDRILYMYIERRKGPREIIAMGVDEALVLRVLKLVNTSEYKRNQFCPIIRVSSKAFGVGRRMPIVGKYLS